jgi:hypothetical protein
VPLIRRTIRATFTDEEIRQIEEEAAHPLVDVHGTLVDMLHQPIYQSPTTIRPAVNTQPYVHGVTQTVPTTNTPLITRGGLRWTPPTTGLVISGTDYVLVGITGAFKWPGNRDNFVRSCLNPLGLHLETSIPHVNYLIVANTTGMGKIRDAVRSQRRIYCEMDFYEAVMRCPTATANQIAAARQAMRSACDNQMMLEYIRRV